jgi:hypothetical protein
MNQSMNNWRMLVIGIILVLCIVVQAGTAAGQEKTILDRTVLYSKMMTDPKTSVEMKSALVNVLAELKTGNADQANELFKQAVQTEMNAIGANTKDPSYSFLNALNTFLNSKDPTGFNDALWQLKDYKDNPDNKDDAKQSMALYLDAMINEAWGRPDQEKNALIYAFKNDPTNSDLFMQCSTFLKENYPDSAETELKALKEETGYTDPLAMSEQNGENQKGESQDTGNGDTGGGDTGGSSE